MNSVRSAKLEQLLRHSAQMRQSSFRVRDSTNFAARLYKPAASFSALLFCVVSTQQSVWKCKVKYRESKEISQRRREPAGAVQQLGFTAVAPPLRHEKIRSSCPKMCCQDTLSRRCSKPTSLFVNLKQCSQQVIEDTSKMKLQYGTGEIRYTVAEQWRDVRETTLTLSAPDIACPHPSGHPIPALPTT